MKVVINQRHSGFGLSNEAVLWLWNHHSALVEVKTVDEFTGGRGFGGKPDKGRMSKYGGREWIRYSKPFREGFTVDKMIEGVLVRDEKVYMVDDDMANFRSHPDLLAVIDALGPKKAGGDYSDLVIVEIPDGVEYKIGEYDGMEWICEEHREWPE